VVVGGGFIGLEVASSALQTGSHVTVLEALPVPLERVLGAQMGEAIAAWHRGHGMDLRLGVAVEALERSEDGALVGVRLADGGVVPADVVVVGIGISPTTAWLEGSGIDVRDGVLCDSYLRVLASGRPLANVAAAGDVARWMHPVIGEPVREEHWTNASNQGEHAARTLLASFDAEAYSPVPYVWSDQHGTKIQFVGRARPDDDLMVLEGSLEEGRFLAAYGRSGRLVAAVGARRPAKIMAMHEMIAEGAAFPPEI
jgi:NADPH-dependent 2,4-dienoyl-CoA reductase/sulfur reductase-like enzyme